MEITITLQDDLAERIVACGITPQNYVKLLLSEARRTGDAREARSRPEDTREFLRKSAIRREAELCRLEAAEQAEDEAYAKAAAAKQEWARRKAALLEEDQKQPATPQSESAAPTPAAVSPAAVSPAAVTPEPAAPGTPNAPPTSASGAAH